MYQSCNQHSRLRKVSVPLIYLNSQTKSLNAMRRRTKCRRWIRYWKEDDKLCGINHESITIHGSCHTGITGDLETPPSNRHASRAGRACRVVRGSPHEGSLFGRHHDCWSKQHCSSSRHDHAQQSDAAEPTGTSVPPRSQIQCSRITQIVFCRPFVTLHI